MKKGDVVMIGDGSYSRSVVDGKSVHEVGLGRLGKEFIIIEIDCKFPVIDPFQQRYETVERFNNTVIQAIDSGKVVFIEERFLRPVPPKHQIWIDVVYHQPHRIGGRLVEISDKLYQEIKCETQ